jgi:hypothetical protein
MKRILLILIICLYADVCAENKEPKFENRVPSESGYLCSENAYSLPDRFYKALRLSSNETDIWTNYNCAS